LMLLVELILPLSWRVLFVEITSGELTLSSVCTVQLLERV